MNINASLFVQMVVFFLGAWVTMKYIWPPLIRAIENRQKKIAEGLRAADLGQSALAEATKKQQAVEAQARAQAVAIVADGEKRGQNIVEQAKTQAQVEADRIVKAANEEADQEIARAKDALRDQVARLAVAGAEQILKREVNVETHKALLEELKAKL
ncbi:F0F1 ATP synthase subunit B [Mesosutterella sp. AGMB02718]|uniref:ATP synthase subunit b n=1 Tax=Mesosutterella faecium TaxID=2925194 RepID=A0ABT7IKF4_9BURK|nr:F0F1 ATP synthase subunit B [Mesosutterella sp. AGMB02718]MDL2058855.1 F0F1 ATP synthase subunit B [Mesosutterella sp. AGMB02718]